MNYSAGDAYLLAKVSDDHEICGRLYLQTCELFAAQFLSEDAKNKFFNSVFASMHKLTATKYHLKNYERIERQQYEYWRRRFRRHRPDDGAAYDTSEAFELIFELDAFLVQVKSSLDMLVKLLDSTLGQNIVSTHTYGDKGEKVIKGLEQYKKKDGVRSRVVDELVRMIREDKDLWLGKAVSLRDELTHVNALRGYQFEPLQLPNGEISAKKPSFRGQETVPLMRLIYQNNVEFHQDFMCLTLALKAPPVLELAEIERESSRKRHGNVPSAEYVKWGWRACINPPLST